MAGYYLVKRGPRPDYHRAPYHPVIICDRKDLAEWECGCTCRESWLWHQLSNDGSAGWLLMRWRGLAICFGPVVHGCKLPDSTPSGIVHDRKAEPYTFLAGAVWWSDRKMPDWLAAAGAVYAPDNHSQEDILHTLVWLDDELFYNGRRKNWPQHKRPAFWPEPVTEPVEVT